MHDKVATTKDIESIAFGKKYIWLPTDQLSDSEKLLIQLGNGSLQPEIDNRNHPWYPILFEHQPVQEPEWIRLLQVHFTRTIDSLQSEWLAEIQQMLPSVVDLFFLTEDHAVIVEKQDGANLPIEDLDGLFVALDMDFDCYSQLFVGPFHHPRHDFTALWASESSLFKNELKTKTTSKSMDLPKVVFSLFRNGFSGYISLFRTLYLDWFEEETETIIQSLWRNQGNASSTAKELFMHRNSLLYKIDKFQTLTRLNLKNMDDLLLCYLLIDQFTHQSN
ncbi:helix-turn-helix domain-containing protein [Enterococcus casseliflavus]|uniref:helix-turn-helix domain-containing protein n=1 Tax=Enterococcus casseliflavus TaxID=37734 RepID=UPI002953E84B|nr:helix-turn-helix domain-containing protein [Enterococcus casseliflavus]MDV7752513.1 helix-turn-helix domain-containing protein [Enterococcus casseliflavus]